MGKLTVDGLGALDMDLKKFHDIPDNVIDAMLQAQADVIEPAQKAKGLAYGVHRTGVTLASIKRGKVKRTSFAAYLYVTPQGKNAKGTPNTAVAFINEFGKHGQESRPFIRDANEESADEVADAAAKVHDGWLSSNGL